MIEDLLAVWLRRFITDELRARRWVSAAKAAAWVPQCCGRIGADPLGRRRLAQLSDRRAPGCLPLHPHPYAPKREDSAIERVFIRRDHLAVKTNQMVPRAGGPLRGGLPTLANPVANGWVAP